MSKRVAILNFAETITSFLRHNSTIAREWILPDIDGTIALETLVALAADEVNNNATPNTLQDLPGFSFPVVNGGTYYFYALIQYDSAAAGTGSRWTINGPATSKLAYRSSISTSAITTLQTNSNNAYQLPAAASSTSAYTTGNHAILEGTLTVTADGTVQFQFASEISGNAITAKAQVSILKYRRIS